MTFAEQSAAPRLARLELQGFKSFANRSLFIFERGITAVIGPNGSGKSNISDGLRWVLGEQSHSLLRSKKTEDVIFAGGNGRAPAGMAEVSVTFDNTTGWLPIEFNEVVVTRRAYRSGENQFLINGRKVRLKDVHQLTASLGHSHTVVGQGLVDTALSQRAEERRSLFEHAADLTGLQLKANEAMRNLNEAESNADRIRDLLREIEPRLKTLERAATQAREWQGVHDRLKELERGYYKEVLAEALEKEAEASDSVEQNWQQVESGQLNLKELEARLRAVKIETESAQAEMAQQNAHVQSIEDQERRIAHEQDLANERLIALKRRRDDMQETQSGLEIQLEKVTSSLDAIGNELELVESDHSEAGRNTDHARAALARLRDASLARERQAASLSSSATNLERKLADVTKKRALIEQQKDTGKREDERFRVQADELEARVADLELQIADLTASDTQARSEMDVLTEKLVAVRLELETARETERMEQVKRSQLQRSIDESEAQLAALQRIQESGAGLYAGVRAVLKEAAAGKLTGVCGKFSELIDVPSAYDTAIEVALGSHLQDIVVNEWSDAERAIAFLKQKRAGRATFQPISHVRAGRLMELPVSMASRAPLHGRASELVRHDTELQGVVQALLGRYLVVEDLPTARAILPELQRGWNLVTLAGEMVRSGGSVTGGSDVRESGILGRERELRDLPARIASDHEQLSILLNAHKRVSDTVVTLASNIQTMDARQLELQTSLASRANEKRRIEAWLADIQNERDRLSKTEQSLQDSRASQQRELHDLESEEERLVVDLARMQGAQKELIDVVQEAREQQDEAEAVLRTAEQRSAGLDERLRLERRNQASLQAQCKTLQEEAGQRSDRSAVLLGEIEGLTEQHGRLAVELSRLGQQREDIEARLPPQREALLQLQQHLGDTERELESARHQMLALERAFGASELQLERVRGDLNQIRQRIEDDLELDDPFTLLATEALLDMPRDEAEREISRLKERLRRVGYVGEEAVTEFERESEHVGFLRDQLTDIEVASLRFHEMLEDLRNAMQSRFDETFEKVAAAFSQAFTTLFGGGAARLVMVSNEAGEGSGVDIVAQPPGKRLQSLALLSGGERALTAVALLFAILKVNPSPFVLLDEVDAALDEANVVRFRDMLQELAAETQAVIITHNRGTIEVANSLYGISMRDDGVSTVLSMRLAESAVAV